MKKIIPIFKTISFLKMWSKIILPLTFIFSVTYKILKKFKFFNRLMFTFKVWLGKNPWSKIFVISRKTTVSLLAELGLFVVWEILGVHLVNYMATFTGMGLPWAMRVGSLWEMAHGWLKTAINLVLLTSSKKDKKVGTAKSKTSTSQELNNLEVKKVQLEEYYNLLFKEIFVRKPVGDLTEREINFQHKLLARMEEILINYDQYLAKNNFKCDLTCYLNLSHKYWTRYHVYLSELHEMGGSNLKTSNKWKNFTNQIKKLFFIK